MAVDNYDYVNAPPSSPNLHIMRLRIFKNLVRDHFSIKFTMLSLSCTVYSVFKKSVILKAIAAKKFDSFLSL